MHHKQPLIFVREKEEPKAKWTKSIEYCLDSPYQIPGRIKTIHWIDDKTPLLWPTKQQNPQDHEACASPCLAAADCNWFKNLSGQSILTLNSQITNPRKIEQILYHF